MSALAAEILDEWRTAERLLRLVPDASADRDRIVAAIEDMRELYRLVTNSTIPNTNAALLAARRRIAETRALLADASARMNP